MTRFARGGTANKKQPLDGSSWDELTSKKDVNEPKHTKLKVDQTEAVTKSGKNGKHKKTSWKQFDTKDDSSEKTLKRDTPAPHQNDLVHMQTKPHKGGKYKKLTNAGGQQKKGKQLLKERQRERRRQKRKHERDMEKVCYNCREPGHHLADCPQIKKDQEQGTGICFKCGSTEHSSAKCFVKVAPGVYPFAKCFICGEKGHISKQCPDNPRGLYPKGGCCKQCGSVEHFRKDCPELQKEQGIQSVTLETLTSHQSADSQGDQTEEYLPAKKKKKKVVNF